ncbi:MAG TPA: outer membrane protein assembly factor BamD [Burkholderiales bacterium]|nr:outer membrane protein assembly factor BamD [Burkholderiales bacterium]
MKRSVALLLMALLLAGCAGGGSEDETAGWSAQRLYSEARDMMNSGNYVQAIEYFEKLEARYPFGRYAQQAQLEIAYAYHREGEAASAVAACDRFIKLHPNHPNVDYAYYLKGVANFYEDQTILGQMADQDPAERDPRSARESFNAFRELVTRFPESKYAQDAQLRMNYIVNALASHEVSVARYYIKRGAYLAAANRAQYAVKTYPQAPAREEALYLMIVSYDQLGMADLRDDARRVLQANFPDSPYLEGKAPVRSAPWWKLWKSGI